MEESEKIIRRETKYKSGKKHTVYVYDTESKSGTINVYYETGQLCAEIPVKEEKKQGLGTFYHSTGRLWMLVPYEDDKCHGMATSYNMFDENIFCETYHNKNLRYTINKYYNKENFPTSMQTRNPYFRHGICIEYSYKDEPISKKRLWNRLKRIFG